MRLRASFWSLCWSSSAFEVSFGSLTKFLEHRCIPRSRRALSSWQTSADSATYGFEPFRSKSTAQISRGDLIVFRLAEEPSMVYMKRVVAVPGDHIQYYERQMTLNGQRAAVTFEGRDGPYQRAKETIEGRATTVAFIPDRPSKD